MVRNKDGNFPEPRNIENPRVKAEHAPKRANGEIKDRPQERMKHE
ncbi:MAG: small, acid-soluble spore protein K [Bacillaceae bacterium]|nr:small, acid-soluble spore protein K [Bacillaceae bacterium]